MAKLITRFQDEPTAANARKIVAHAVKHPMALCLLTAEDMEYVRAARAMIG